MGLNVGGVNVQGAVNEAGRDIDKEKKLGPTLTTLRGALIAGALNLNPEKNPDLIKFLEKAHGLPETGKPSPELLTTLGIEKIKDLSGSHVADAISKLEKEGKLGPAIYQPGGDSSYLYSLSAAMNKVEQGKVAGLLGSRVGGFLNNLTGGIAGEVVGAATGGQNLDWNGLRATLNSTLPPRTTTPGSPAASGPDAAVSGASAPTAPAQATPSVVMPATSGSVVLTSNKANEIVDGLKSTIAELKNAELKIVSGQQSRIIQFLEKALELKDADGKDVRTGKPSPQLLAALGIQNIKELTGEKIAEVVGKAQEAGKFAQGADPELIRSFREALRETDPSVFSNPIAAGKIKIGKISLDDALKDVGPAPAKTSLNDINDIDAPVVVASAKGGYVAPEDRLPSGAQLLPSGAQLEAALAELTTARVVADRRPEITPFVAGGCDVAGVDAGRARQTLDQMLEGLQRTSQIIGGIIAGARENTGGSFAASLDPERVQTKPQIQLELAGQQHDVVAVKAAPMKLG